MIKEKTQNNYIYPHEYSHILTTLLLVLILLSTTCTLYINYNMFLYSRKFINAFEQPGSFLKNILAPSN